MHDHEGAGAARYGTGVAAADRDAAADYVAALSAELAALARQHGLDALG